MRRIHATVYRRPVAADDSLVAIGDLPHDGVIVEPLINRWQNVVRFPAQKVIQWVAAEGSLRGHDSSRIR